VFVNSASSPPGQDLLISSCASRDVNLHICYAPVVAVIELLQFATLRAR
jgi:hypothetical protein